MRDLETQSEKERKRIRNSRIISFFFLIILVLSSAGYAFLSYQGNPNTSSDSNVQNNGNQWIVKFQDQTLAFSSSPESASNVPVTMNKDINSYIAKPLYIVSDNEGISYEIASNLGKYAQRTQLACYENCENSEFPEKTCADNLIVWKSSQENKVYQENNCIFIEGDMRAVDAFLYKIFKVL